MVQSKVGLKKAPAQVYPLASRVHKPEVLQRQPFKEVLGITVHYTASRNLEGTLRSMELDRLGYHLVIDRDGTIVQTALFTHAVAHAGEASWHGISPNRNHLAVAFVGWGLLDKGKTDGPGLSYANVKIDPQNIRIDKKKMKWEAATHAQEQALKAFLVWACIEFKIDPENICGHDECATPKGRKTDPGNSLSMSMESFRASVAASI